MSLTFKEEQWLRTHAGRNSADLFMDEEGRKFVMMWSGKNHEEVKIYLNQHEGEQSLDTL